VGCRLWVTPLPLWCRGTGRPSPLRARQGAVAVAVGFSVALRPGSSASARQFTANRAPAVAWAATAITSEEDDLTKRETLTRLGAALEIRGQVGGAAHGLSCTLQRSSIVDEPDWHHSMRHESSHAALGELISHSGLLSRDYRGLGGLLANELLATA
jgi:hypothetical protein